jgi:hypothetical protein
MIAISHGIKATSPSIARSSCLSHESDLDASFEGDISNLNTFHEILKSARVLKAGN